MHQQDYSQLSPCEHPVIMDTRYYMDKIQPFAQQKSYCIEVWLKMNPAIADSCYTDSKLRPEGVRYILQEL